MEAEIDVLAALEATAKQASLESLAKSGKKNFRVIRGRDVAHMVQEAVQRALASSEWIAPEKVAALKAEAEREFAEVESERQAEHRRTAELERELERLRGRIAELESPSGRPASGDTATAVMMMRMMEELHTLRQQVPSTAGGMPAQATGNVETLLDKKLQQIVGSLDDRLDKLGRKMGISTAIDTASVDFAGLVNKTVAESDNLESNVDNVGTEKRDSAGIGANLDRIKKLREKKG
jgi:hypothetical protein